MTNKARTPLTEIAKRIDAHLQRFDRDKAINVFDPVYKTSRFFSPGAYRAGAYVAIRYVSYQHTSTLNRADAEAYLADLDTGFVGTHREAECQRASKAARS